MSLDRLLPTWVRLLATDADDAVLTWRPVLARRRRCEERTRGGRARLAPKAEGVIARAHVRADEPQSRYAGMLEMKAPKRNDAAVVRWTGRPLHSTRPSESHRNQKDPHARER